MLSFLVSLAVASAPAAEARFLRTPDIHGDLVAFSYAADLWIADVEGGPARRLTSDPRTEISPRFSPCGRWIAFNASYDGDLDVYVLSVDGGEPRRVTYGPGPDFLLDWTPDGRIAFTTYVGSWGGWRPRLYLVDAEGGMPAPTDLHDVDAGSFSPDGGKLAYIRVSSNLQNWRNYRGGQQGIIGIWDFAARSYTELPHGRENDWDPMWIGNSLFFISDRNQRTVNLYRYDLADRRVEQLTAFDDGDIRNPATDGKRIVFERNAALHLYDVATRRWRVLNPDIRFEKLAARPYVRQVGDQVRALALSPSGVRVVLDARGHLFSVPAKSGETRFVVDRPGREAFPAWSPDGQSIAYLSDETGEQELWVVPQRGGEPTRLTDGGPHVFRDFAWTPDSKAIVASTLDGRILHVDVESKKRTVLAENRRGIYSYDISPDGAWLAYSAPVREYGAAVHLYEFATGRTTRVTEGFYLDSAVAFDLSGKHLYVISNRTYQPSFGTFEFGLGLGPTERLYVVPLSGSAPSPLEPPEDEEPLPPAEGDKPAEKKDEEKPKVAIDLEGFEKRFVPLPLPSGSHSALYGLREGVLFVRDGTLFRFELSSRQPTRLSVTPMGTLSAWTLNAGRTKIAYAVAGTVGIRDLAPDLDLSRGDVNLAGVQITVDPRREWEQMYWEAWRWMRDRFYDPAMRGLDWRAIGERYARLLPHVAHRNDLNALLGLLIGELETGHAYVGGGETVRNAPPPVAAASLGADYELDGDFVRIARIYRGYPFEEENRGPLAQPGLGVKEGDYLLAIDGQPVGRSVPVDRQLVGKAGRTVALTVNDRPTLEGARRVLVRPVGSDGRIRYIDWVEDNRRKVAELSGGQIGYLHVPNTGVEGMIGFLRGWYSQLDKRALLIDVRYNGGGFIPTPWLDFLTRRTFAIGVARYGVPGPTGANFDGPMAMLVNEYAASGGDMLPWLFKRAGLGPLVGRRTWGGLVGINEPAPLVDGGFLFAPAFGFFDPATGEWIAENKGVEPDVEVDLRPDLLARGRDPQLERGVQILLEAIRRQRRPEPRVPRVPPIPPRR